MSTSVENMKKESQNKAFANKAWSGMFTNSSYIISTSSNILHLCPHLIPYTVIALTKSSKTVIKLEILLPWKS